MEIKCVGVWAQDRKNFDISEIRFQFQEYETVRRQVNDKGELEDVYKNDVREVALHVTIL